MKTREVDLCISKIKKFVKENNELEIYYHEYDLGMVLYGTEGAKSKLIKIYKKGEREEAIGLSMVIEEFYVKDKEPIIVVSLTIDDFEIKNTDKELFDFAVERKFKSYIQNKK